MIEVADVKTQLRGWMVVCRHAIEEIERLEARVEELEGAPDKSLDTLLREMLGEASVHFMSQPEGRDVVMPTEELSAMADKWASLITFRERPTRHGEERP